MYKSSLFAVSPELRPFITLLVILDLVLKGITLYKSARNEQKAWFVALLVVNSLGILPIVYLFLNKDIAVTTSKVTPSNKIIRKKK